MEVNDKNRLIQYYTSALDVFGEHDARSVHWSDFENQQKRFLILATITDLNNKSVLDVGCGLGDLYKFFLTQHTSVNYTGIDIVPDFITLAKKRFPDAQFEQKDIFTVTDQYDYVLASGALSFKVKDNERYYYSMIKRMYDCAREGLAFNMLNRAHHIDDETYATYNPDDVAAYCRTFCPNVQIIIGYLPQDLTLYLYKK